MIDWNSCWGCPDIQQQTPAIQMEIMIFYCYIIAFLYQYPLPSEIQQNRKTERLFFSLFLSYHLSQNVLLLHIHHWWWWRRKKINQKLARREIVMSQYTMQPRSIRLSQRAFRNSKIESGHLPVYPSSLSGPVAQVNICFCCSYFIFGPFL